MINCPECNQPMAIQDWTQDIKICTCDKCKIRKYFSKVLDRLLTHSEVNVINKDWE